MKRAVFLLFLLAISSLVSALDCPKGLTNDPYPGECALYTDSNKDNICDYSQTAPSIQPKKELTLTKPRYYFIEISIACIALYLFSYFASKSKFISPATHKKIWNIFLLASFLVTAITSILILLSLDLNFNINPGLNLSFWHIELGLVMIWISIFHTLWHIPYFKSYLK